MTYNDEMAINEKTSTQIKFDCLATTLEGIRGNMTITYTGGKVTKQSLAELLV